MSYNEELIKKRLFPFDSSSRISIDDSFFTKSAVLLCIIPRDENPYELVFIHRANKGKKHRGEMAFPGGKYDSMVDNSLRDTALRECEEEIGVSREKIKILGCLHDFPTMTQFIITPFVGVFETRQKLVKDEREVQEIIRIPISFFMEKKTFNETAMDFEGKSIPVFFFKYTKKDKIYLIWGATAYIIASFIKIIYKYDLSELKLSRLSINEIKSLQSLNLNGKKFNNHLKRINNQ